MPPVYPYRRRPEETANGTPCRESDTGIDLLEKGSFDSPEHFDLRFQTARLDLAHREDRFVALKGSRINIEPYQVQAAYDILSSYDHRYLVGDEVGLGKTIEAVGDQGDGIAKVKRGYVVIVPDGKPGQQPTVVIDDVRRNVSFETVVDSSPSSPG